MQYPWSEIAFNLEFLFNIFKLKYYFDIFTKPFNPSALRELVDSADGFVLGSYAGRAFQIYNNWPYRMRKVRQSLLVGVNNSELTEAVDDWHSRLVDMFHQLEGKTLLQVIMFSEFLSLKDSVFRLWRAAHMNWKVSYIHRISNVLDSEIDSAQSYRNLLEDLLALGIDPASILEVRSEGKLRADEMAVMGWAELFKRKREVWPSLAALLKKDMLIGLDFGLGSVMRWNAHAIASFDSGPVFIRRRSLYAPRAIEEALLKEFKKKRPIPDSIVAALKEVYLILLDPKSLTGGYRNPENLKAESVVQKRGDRRILDAIRSAAGALMREYRMTAQVEGFCEVELPESTLDALGLLL